MNLLKRICAKIYYYLPIGFLLKPFVLFESNPDFCDNTRGIFNRLVELGYNEKYKLIWFVTDKKKFDDINIKNVLFIDWADKKKVKYYQRVAKYIIDCNRYIYKKNKYQLRIYLTHGTPLKNVPDYCLLCGRLDYIVQISDFFTEINNSLYNKGCDKMISTGFPRNDILLNESDKIFFPNIKRKKTICWFPTYRNHKNHSSGENVFPYGIPSVNNEKELKELNEYLKKEDVLLTIILHPAEDTSILRKLDFERIKLVNDDVFDVDHKTLYHYLSNVDALITDYSSVYYDFLLTKKPIGLAVCDIKEYAKTTKLVFDNYEENVVGEYIYNFKELLDFIHHVSIGEDVSYKKRMEKRVLYHKYFDDKSSDRIISLMKKKGFKK